MCYREDKKVTESEKDRKEHEAYVEFTKKISKLNKELNSDPSVPISQEYMNKYDEYFKEYSDKLLILGREPK